MSPETARMALAALRLHQGPYGAFRDETNAAIAAIEAELVTTNDEPAPRGRLEIISDLVEQRKVNFDQAAEIIRLRGEAGVLKRLLVEALEPLNIALFEADDADEEALLAALIGKIAKALKA